MATVPTMLVSLAISAPPSSHFIYIPVIFIIGIVLGFVLGAKATRDAIALEQRKAAAREARQASRRPPDAPQA